ncbi:MAG: hypothetical protein WD407_04465 [Rhodospirillales bacterium]
MPGVAAAAIASVAASSLASIVAQVVISLVASVILGQISKALQKKPAQQFTATPETTLRLRDRTLTVRQPVAAGRVIYGRTRIGGVYTFVHTTGSSNERLHLVITLSGHCKLNAIGNLYFDGEHVPIAGSGHATGRFAGNVKMYTRLGDPDQTAIQELINAVPAKWTADHRQRGCAHVYLQLIWDQDKFPNGIPNIRFDVEGKADVYDPRTDSFGYTTNAALCAADYLANSVWGVGAGYGTEIGDDDLIEAANICDEMVDRTPKTVAYTPNAADNTLTLANGSALLGLGTRVTVSSDRFLPGGLEAGTEYYWIPAARYPTKAQTAPATATLGWFVAGTLGFLSTGTYTTGQAFEILSTDTGSVAAGQTVYWIADIGGGAGRFAASEADALAGTAIPIVFGQGTLRPVDNQPVIPESTKPVGYLAASLDDARAGVAIDLTSAGEGTHTITADGEPRYAVDGAFETDGTPVDILGQLLSASAGELVWSGGRFRIRAGAHRLPVVDLDEGDIVGPLKTTSLVPSRESFNGVKGTFFSPEADWQEDDFPAYSRALYVAEDGGEESWFDITLAWTISPFAATRLAKIELERQRRQITVEGPFKTKLWRALPADTVRLSIARYGFEDKVFGARRINLRPEENDGALVFKVAAQLRETDAAVWQWAASEAADYQPAPKTTLPSPFVPRAVPNVAGLELRGDGANLTTFTGRTAKFVWREAAAWSGQDLDSPDGADSGARDLEFKDFEIRIVDPATEETVRVEHVLDPHYDYTYEKNAEDYRIFTGGPGAYRRFTLEVYIRGTQNQLSERAARLTVENPAPALPAAANLRAVVDQLWLDFAPSADPDYQGVLLWAELESGFDPAATDPVADSTANGVRVDLAGNTTYFVRFALYDVFGKDPDQLTVSAEFEVATSGAPGPLPKFTFDGLVFTPNSPGANKVAWGAANAHVTLAGDTESYGIAAGNATWSEGVLYLYYENGHEALSATATLTQAVGDDKIILATYKGGTDLTVGAGEAFFDGARILAQTVGAAQLVTGQAVITETAQIAEAIIDTAAIENLAVTTGKIDNLAVTAAKIDNLAVTEAKIDDLAVTSAKIDNLAVTTGKIADVAIETAKIKDAAITTGKIDDLAVTDAKIANLAVTDAKIANLAVTSAKIDDLAVTTGKIQDLQVTTAKIDDNAVTSQQFNDGTSSATIVVAASGTPLTLFFAVTIACGVSTIPSAGTRTYSGSAHIRVRRGGNTIYEGPDGSITASIEVDSNGSSFTVIDQVNGSAQSFLVETVSPDTYTYVVDAVVDNQSSSGGANAVITVIDAVLLSLETKK